MTQRKSFQNLYGSTMVSVDGREKQQRKLSVPQELVCLRPETCLETVSASTA